MDLEKIRTCCESLEQDITALRMTERIEYDFYSAMIDAVQTIDAEITAPPKSNADRIRQMTDEELAALIANENDFCSLCAYKSDTPICTKPLAACTHGFYEWLKQEVSEDAR